VAKQEGTEEAFEVDTVSAEDDGEVETVDSSLEADANEDDATPLTVQSMGDRKSIIEALIYVSDEPLNAKSIAEVLKEDQSGIEIAIASLVEEFNGRGSGLQLREVAGGWQFATRPEFHEHVRAFLKSRPSAKLRSFGIAEHRGL
jgi:hypothetical protein